jgi:hypothetical protein
LFNVILYFNFHKHSILNNNVVIAIIIIIIDKEKRLDNFHFLAYNYGSTAHTFISTNKQWILKQYDMRQSMPRWIEHPNHKNLKDIYEKELAILLKLQKPVILYFNQEKGRIIMSYCGVSLYNCFNILIGGIFS